MLVDNHKIDEIIAEVKGVAKLDDPSGKTISQMELDNNLMLYQVTCPIGVIGAIFESKYRCCAANKLFVLKIRKCCDTQRRV